jgi:hypothetical protein
MRLMPKKSAKKVKAKKSKRPATTREVASLALSRKLTKAGKRVTKKAAKPAAKKPAKPVTKMAKPAAKKPAKPVAKMAKPVAKKAAKPLAPKAAVAKSSPRMDSHLRRRDGSGHLDPKYAADLLRQSGRPESEGVGFLAHSRSNDDLAEALGEQFVEGATTGEGPAEDELDQEVPEERGGPFVRSNAGTEFAEGTDRSNPKGAKREPFPTT